MHEITADVGPTSPATHPSKAPATVSSGWACCLSSRMAALARMQRSTFRVGNTRGASPKHPGLFYLTFAHPRLEHGLKFDISPSSHIFPRLVAPESIVVPPESLPYLTQAEALRALTLLFMFVCSPTHSARLVLHVSILSSDHLRLPYLTSLFPIRNHYNV